MTGPTADDGYPQAERSTDSESATRTPNQDRGVVQDSPGSPDIGTAHDSGGAGNLTEAELEVTDRENEAPDANDI
ncbi:hypothetical protein [Deinococcus sonorensis]|uniref:MatE family transporter n=2 Tax=Deinococcus sonorensis TaxID=309891 RepID=A0AAU7UDV3_9DEIO